MAVVLASCGDTGTAEITTESPGNRGSTAKAVGEGAVPVPAIQNRLEIEPHEKIQENIQSPKPAGP